MQTGFFPADTCASTATPLRLPIDHPNTTAGGLRNNLTRMRTRGFALSPVVYVQDQIEFSSTGGHPGLL